MAPLPQIFDGDNWVVADASQFSYYDGNDWVAPSDVKHWNGSAWESIFPVDDGSLALRTSISSEQNTVSSLDITIPASTEVGDLLVLLVSQTSNAATLFNAIAGWTKHGEQRAGVSALTIGVYTRLAQLGDPGSDVTTTSLNAANYVATMRVYQNVNQVSPLDTAVVFDEVTTADTDGPAPAVTVVTAGSMIVTVHGVPSVAGETMTSADFTDPSGMSNEIVVCTSNTNNNPALATYNQITPGTGAQGPFTASLGITRRWALATIVIRPV